MLNTGSLCPHWSLWAIRGLSFLFPEVPGIEPRSLCLLGNHCTSNSTLYPLSYILSPRVLHSVFHHSNSLQNPRFPGNLQMSDRQLDEAGESDVNNL